MAPPYTLKLRRDKASRWSRLNPILAEGEPGFEVDTGRLKIGDGSTRWQALDYFLPGNLSDTPNTKLTAHVNAPEPHPVYDDGPSLELLYQNAKV
jgi:hypothetical protein